MGSGPRQYTHSKVNNPASKANGAAWLMATENPNVVGGWKIPAERLSDCHRSCRTRIIAVTRPVVRFTPQGRNIYAGRRATTHNWEVNTSTWQGEPIIRESLLADPEFDTRVVMVYGSNGATIMHYDHQWWVVWAIYPHRPDKKWRRVVLHSITSAIAIAKHEMTYASWLEQFEELFAAYANNSSI